jgi:osmotically inducible protein OsmC
MSDEKINLNGPDLAKGIAPSRLADGSMLLGHVQGEPVLLARQGGELFAIGAARTMAPRSSRGCSWTIEAGAGTNPEELLGAAHAGCFAMALSLVLSQAGFKPDFIDAIAHVTVSPREGGFKITQSRIVCEAKVSGIDEAQFLKYAAQAGSGCPVSQALSGIEIALEAKLR